MHTRKGSHHSVGKEESKSKPSSKQHSRRQSVSSKNGEVMAMEFNDMADEI